MKNIALVLLTGGLIFGAWLFWSTSNDQNSARRAYESAGKEVRMQADMPEDHVAMASSAENMSSDIMMPSLSAKATQGRAVFNARCASCHGNDATGGPGGPPLIHKIYEPSHHGDAAFHLAVQNGVVAHHWGFGNMPAQSGVTRAMTESVIAFVREVQRANGIH